MIEFSKLGLSQELLKAVKKQGFDICTTVQEKTIPAMMEMRDVVAKAPTGTGKTIAFAAPILNRLATDEKNVRALILCPTRELAIQIRDEIQKLCVFTPWYKSVAIYGGQGIIHQLNALKQKPQIVVATPGRLNDHLNRGSIELSHVETVVLDEADRMLDMGFVKDVCRILDKTSDRKNLALMSATISVEVMDIAWKYQRDAVEIEVAEIAQDKPLIDQFSVDVSGSKVNDMIDIIKQYNFYRIMVFCNTKHMVQRLTKTLGSKGLDSDCIHGDVRQSAREAVMRKFRAGKLQVLVATDVAARGLDIDDVDAVINYDLPNENEYYLHRIGRTGRARKTGISFAFVTHFDEKRLKEIVKYTQVPMKAMKFDENRVLVAKN